MQSSPLISVIIPTYNGAKWIRDTIKSVTNQSFNDFEILVVDDGSNDSTVETVEKFDDERIRLLVNSQNKGIPATRNRGIHKSRGKYLCFLDQDDKWIQKKLEKQVDILQNNTQVGVTYSDAFVINENGTRIGIRTSSEGGRPDLLFDLFMNNRHFLQTTKMIRKKCFDQAGSLDADLRWGADDQEFDIRLAKRTDWRFMKYPEPLAEKRIHPDNTSKNKAKIYEEFIQITNKHSNNSRLAPYRDIRLSEIYSKLCYHYAVEGELTNALRSGFKSIKHNPKNPQALAVLPAVLIWPLRNPYLHLLKSIHQPPPENRSLRFYDEN